VVLRPSSNITVATKSPVERTDFRRSDFFNGLFRGQGRSQGRGLQRNDTVEGYGSPRRPVYIEPLHLKADGLKWSARALTDDFCEAIRERAGREPGPEEA